MAAKAAILTLLLFRNIVIVTWRKQCPRQLGATAILNLRQYGDQSGNYEPCYYSKNLTLAGCKNAPFWNWTKMAATEVILNLFIILHTNTDLVIVMVLNSK